MKTTRVYREIESIINGNMPIAEKMKAVKEFDYDRRPGKAKAKEMADKWYWGITRKQEALRNNLHSAESSDFSLSMKNVFYHATPKSLQGIINDCKEYGFDDFSRKMTFAINDCYSEFALPLPVLDRRNGRNVVKTYAEWLYPNSYWYEFDGWIFLMDCFTFRKQLGKMMAGRLREMMLEYKREIAPVIEQRKAEERKREQENAQWIEQVGIWKYRGNHNEKDGYVTSTADIERFNRYTPMVVYPFVFKMLGCDVEVVKFGDKSFSKFICHFQRRSDKRFAKAIDTFLASTPETS